MKKFYLSSWYLLLVTCMGISSCTDYYNDFSELTRNDEMHTAEQVYREIFETYPQWKSKIQIFSRLGTVHLDKTAFNYNGKYGFHYIVPISDGQRITHFIVCQLGNPLTDEKCDSAVKDILLFEAAQLPHACSIFSNESNKPAEIKKQFADNLSDKSYNGDCYRGITRAGSAKLIMSLDATIGYDNRDWEHLTDIFRVVRDHFYNAVEETENECPDISMDVRVDENNGKYICIYLYGDSLTLGRAQMVLSIFSGNLYKNFSLDPRYTTHSCRE